MNTELIKEKILDMFSDTRCPKEETLSNLEDIIDYCEQYKTLLEEDINS